MKIAIGSDHAGFRYKEMIKAFLEDKGHKVKDFGAYSEDPVDYPLYIRPVAEAVARGEHDRGIVLGGSGNGEAMVANRVRGIRCALCWSKESALMARKHNDANMLSLGQRMLSEDAALDIVGIWLETPFDGGRHLPRIQMIDKGMSGTSRDKWSEEAASGMVGQGDKGPGESQTGKPGAENYDVTISFGYILYSEGKNILEFKVDPGLKRPTIIHVPASETWREETPAWARERREQILDRIAQKCVHFEYQWEEY